MIITIISIIALCIFLFSIDLTWSNVVSAERNDLVFEGRNMNYGAYAIRKEHHRHVFYALLFSVGLIGGGMFALGSIRSKPVSAPNPSERSIIIPMNIKPVEKAKPAIEKEESPKQKDDHRAMGNENPEVEVVEDNQLKPIVSELDKHIGAGDDPEGIVEPVVVDGGGSAGTKEDGNSVANGEKKKARRYVKNPPEFPGGLEAMLEYMHKKVRYSDVDIDRNVEGTIYISFVVNEDGSIDEIVMEQGIRNGEHLTQKAMDAINAMPRWKPGNDGEEPLRVIVTMPLRFALHD